jgi:hypothetical protein
MRNRLLLAAAVIVTLALGAWSAPAAEAGKPTPVLQYTDRVWGDILCNGQVDAGDIIPVFRSIEQKYDYPDPGGCPNVIFGMAVQGFEGNRRWSDVDCSNTTDVLDVLAILRTAASFPPIRTTSCPTIGETYSVAIVGK